MPDVKSLQRPAIGVRGNAGVKSEPIVVPRTDDFAQEVNRTLAQRITLVGTAILNSKERTMMQYKANPFTVCNDQLWTVLQYSLTGFVLTVEYLKPLHNKWI